ncbi:hypothetical protein FRACYDRAFT_193193 [Fragilariopsis cylindrus CCMP1102]|uniref:Fe2OG dioxygenase domain-containing protein n=1 Tax=Fragilariopsis cylindrus CCMP1102 TaxID=635003 RepID=A0A1E7EYZ0_9STRA|nr:hypothetical protein FRACYDRAFT_193193 [Fragilariopsis cylindrus CCMP1102]|eukprot:OEU11046.1 hypothetical protein FRACYDRAFT_193193 [Fragilariopsis cylindrus CCMP1102]
MNGDTTNTSVALTADSATAAASPVTKKSKTKSIFDDDSSNILSSDLFTKIDVQSYQQSKPYPHQQITNVFKAQFLLDLKEEIKLNSKVNFKESDLFRVYQSIDLANLNNLSSSSPPPGPEEEEATKCKLTNSLLLRDILYSQEWRSYIEQCTGLQPGTLINKIDCACNCHTPGCHLLCHDDVIGTRKISYIIYLTEIDWNTNKEGGTLELYDQQLDEENDEVENDNDDSKSRSSQPVPVSRIQPIFNSMAFFEVLPGRSYHAVQEVIGDRPRLSLQGWYHSNEIPKNIENATLQQLKTMNNTKLKLKKVDVDVDNDPTITSSSSSFAATTDNENNDADTADTTIADTDTTNTESFTENDRIYLKEYIKNEYLTDKSMNEIRVKFENNSSVQFCNFLLEKYVPKIQSSTVANPNTNDDDPTNDENYYMQGVTSEWKLRGPAHKQRYLRYEEDYSNNSSDVNSDNNDDAASTGSIMNTVKKQVFESEPFKRYLKAVTSLDYSTGIIGNEIRRFRPGLDYTVAHYGLLSNMDEVGVLDATMCFVDDKTEDKKGYWECGDVGGFECYIEADIDDEDDIDDDEEVDENDDDEYNEDDDTELLSVSASNNTLSLVYRDPGTMRFVKYVGSSAPSSRYDICMEYELPPDNDNDNDVIDEEEGEADDDVNEEDEEEVMMKESK